MCYGWNHNSHWASKSVNGSFFMTTEQTPFTNEDVCIYTVFLPLTHIKLPSCIVENLRCKMFSNFPTSSTNLMFLWTFQVWNVFFFSPIHLIACEFKVSSKRASTKQPLCPHSHSTCFGRDKQHFFTSSTLQSAVKIYSDLMEWAGWRSAGSLLCLEKSWGPGQ